MQVLEIPETRLSPSVYFDPSLGALNIKGRSIPEDAVEFYKPVIQALEQYEEHARPETTVNFAFIHFATSSSKCILQILNMLARFHKRVTKVKINWYYDITDEDLLETAKDLEEISTLKFNFIGVNPEDDSTSEN
jgi:hypothetical protein